MGNLGSIWAKNIKDISDIIDEQVDQLEQAWYFGWDDKVARIESRLDALDALIWKRLDEEYEPVHSS